MAEREVFQNEVVGLLRILLYYTRITRSLREVTEKLVIRLCGPSYESVNRGSPEETQPGQVYVSQVATPFRRYEQFTVIYFSYVLAKYILPVDHVVNLMGLEKPANCYLPGRLVSNNSISGFAGAVVSSLVLYWMLWQRVKRPKIPHTFIFLSQSKEAVRKQDETFSEYGHEEYSNIAGVKVVDVLLHYLMFYPTHVSGQPKYRIRPNRSSLARKMLIDRLKLIINWTHIAGGLAAIVLVVVSLHEIISNSGHISAYPGCSPELKKMFDENESSTLFSAFTWTRAYITIMDLIETTMLWSETVIGVLYVIPMSLTVHYDLELYWDSISVKLDRLSNILTQNHYARARSHDSAYMQDRGVQFQSENKDNQIARTFSPIDERLVDEIALVLAEMKDFFQQFRQSEPLVSDIITMGVIVWLTTFYAISYICMTIKISGSLLVVRFLQAIGICVLSITISLLWIIHKRLIRSHLTLRSIVGYPIPTQLKWKYLGILDLYNGHEGITFKILGRYPLSPNTYISLLSWTVGCFIIFENFVMTSVTDSLARIVGS